MSGDHVDFRPLALQMLAALEAMTVLVAGLPEDVCELHADNLNALSDKLDAVSLEGLRACLAIAAAPSPLLLAARAVMAVRPTNWDDVDDQHAVAAWTALQDALKPADPDDLACGICALGFVEGDPCLTDIDLGPVHAACCGPERESYVDLATGEPLKDGQPIPTPWIWSGLFAAKPAALTPGATILRHHDGRTGTFVEIEADGRLRVQSLKGKGFWIFAPHQCDRVETERPDHG